MQSKFITIRLQCELVEPNYKYKDFAIFLLFLNYLNVFWETYQCEL